MTYEWNVPEPVRVMFDAVCTKLIADGWLERAEIEGRVCYRFLREPTEGEWRELPLLARHVMTAIARAEMEACVRIVQRHGLN